MTTSTATADPILAKFRAALDEVYGSRIERVILFGSRARGDAQPESDYDVALFIDGLTDTWEEIDRLVEIEESFRDEGADIHTMPFPAGYWRDQASPLMHEVRKDGLDL